MTYIRSFLLLGTCLITLNACQTFDGFTNDLSLAKDEALSVGSAPAAQTKVDELLASPCPQVELVDDLSSLSDFTAPDKQNANNMISRVDLKSAESTCKLATTSAIVDLKIIFNGKLGAKGRQKTSDRPFFSYPFFVAVTAPSGKILAKEIFSASLSYGAGENTHTYFENLRQIIPIKSKDQAKHYKVLVGFQLSPEQLAYNRANMVPVANAHAVEAAQLQE